MSFYKYGPARKNFATGNVQAIPTMDLCIKKYKDTGNREYLLDEPHISKFIMFVMILFCMWKGISGLTRNIMRLQLNKTISELEKMINERKKEDSKRL